MARLFSRAPLITCRRAAKTPLPDITVRSQLRVTSGPYSGSLSLPPTSLLLSSSISLSFTRVSFPIGAVFPEMLSIPDSILFFVFFLWASVTHTLNRNYSSPVDGIYTQRVKVAFFFSALISAPGFFIFHPVSVLFLRLRIVAWELLDAAVVVSTWIKNSCARCKLERILTLAMSLKRRMTTLLRNILFQCLTSHSWFCRLNVLTFCVRLLPSDNSFCEREVKYKSIDVTMMFNEIRFSRFFPN